MRWQLSVIHPKSAGSHGAAALDIHRKSETARKLIKRNGSKTEKRNGLKTENPKFGAQKGKSPRNEDVFR
jgi:hypothetical protein